MLIRPSGTEPVLRTYAEASDPDTVREILEVARKKCLQFS